MLPKTASKMIYGTEGYIELERLNGGRGDYRADIFSMGAVWYAMLMGRTPLDPSSLEDAFTPIVMPLPMPEPLIAVLRGALAPRAERHHSAASMVRAIHEALQQIEAQQQQREQQPIAGKPARGRAAWKRRAVVLAAVLGVGVVAAALVPTTLRCPQPVVVAAAVQEVLPPPAEPAPPALAQPAPAPAPPVLPLEVEEVNPPAEAPAWESQTSGASILANSPPLPTRTTPRPASALRRALAACKPKGAHLDIAIGPGEAVTINDGPARGELGRCVEDAVAKHPPKRAERFKL